MTLADFPRVPLTFGPSPVHRLERLSQHLGDKVEAIRLCARLEGMLTDPVYEGKSMAALIDLVRDGRIAPGSRVLYAHLGGQPALNGYAGVF
jgi:1-aminocyclopropane-1-carboxylate deaminase